MFAKVFFGLLLLGLHQTYLCDEHTYGKFSYVDKVLFGKELFNKTTLQPKNYTVIFKYIAPSSSPNITHVSFKVHNSNSTGFIEVNTTSSNERTVQATLNIWNATRISVTVQIYGSSIFIGHTALDHGINALAKPKTFTVVYGHNATQTRDRRINLGQRQSGDKLLSYQHKNVTLPERIFKKFAEDDFYFNGNQKYITSIQFAFDSPSAIVFLNSSQIKQNSVEAIVYDLNRPYFSAHMSVFGYDLYDKPSSYQSIVTAKKIQQ